MARNLIGCVRKVDELGRIVIPKEMRKVLGWDCGTPLEIVGADGGVKLRKYDAEETFEEVVKGLIADGDKDKLVAYVEHYFAGQQEEAKYYGRK